VGLMDKKLKRSPHCLSDLRMIILEERKLKAKEFDGMFLTYPNVKFALQSAHEGIWTIYKGKKVESVTTKELKENIDIYIKKR